MSTVCFDRAAFYGYLIKGSLRDAVEYLCQFPDQAERIEKYHARFDRQQYLSFDIDPTLNRLLLIYQQYYRDVFYLQTNEKTAADTMMRRFAAELGKAPGTVEELETTVLADAFQSHAYSFLGGKTAGYYGPYIWKNTEAKTYQVELPEGVQTYTVYFLDGFLSKSWLDYISLGEVGTGGWVGDDGSICCVKTSYDQQSEAFRVSLLKHEAQHAMDQARYPDMASEELEYRAKLVELIYSEERDLLTGFAQEADPTNTANSHALASSRIVSAYPDRKNLSVAEVQTRARKLFQMSCEEQI